MRNECLNCDVREEDDSTTNTSGIRGVCKHLDVGPFIMEDNPGYDETLKNTCPRNFCVVREDVHDLV
jgi:hypothetical protein